MNIIIRICLGILSVAFSAYVLNLVAKGRLLLKYSLLWLILCLAMLICAIFPGVVYALSDLTGITAPSNLVFLVGIAILLAIALSLSVVVSKQVLSIKNLSQRIAILEKETQDISR